MRPTQSQVLSPRSILSGRSKLSNQDFHDKNLDNTEDRAQYQRMLRAKNREVAERFKYYEMKKEIDQINTQERVNAIKMEKEHE